MLTEIVRASQFKLRIASLIIKIATKIGTVLPVEILILIKTDVLIGTCIGAKFHTSLSCSPILWSAQVAQEVTKVWDPRPKVAAVQYQLVASTR